MCIRDRYTAVNKTPSQVSTRCVAVNQALSSVRCCFRAIRNEDRQHCTNDTRHHLVVMHAAAVVISRHHYSRTVTAAAQPLSLQCCSLLRLNADIDCVRLTTTFCALMYGRAVQMASWHMALDVILCRSVYDCSINDVPYHCITASSYYRGITQQSVIILKRRL